MRRRGFQQFGRTIRVDGGLKARSARGAIGESWWSKRFLDVLESFALGSRLARGRNYARIGQVLSLDVTAGLVRASVQGSRPRPYDVRIGLATYDEETWSRIEAALAEQALFSARLLAGEMPRQIEKVFLSAEAPLFPMHIQDLAMECSCPDREVPCKHIAATFYLLAEAFDDDPFRILHWRGRDRQTLLDHLRRLRSGVAETLPGMPGRARSARGRRSNRSSRGTTEEPVRLGAAAALTEIREVGLEEAVDRYWVAPVPLPKRPPILDTDVDLLLRQLPPPPPALGGRELAERLRAYYAGFRPASSEPDA
ncbi:MAG TPA: SWIM zinc finger family protein [Micromonosporaceae bacterium]|nr:SWIM zinc finger family protein [Micromonosporaceae bacterium]